MTQLAHLRTKIAGVRRLRAITRLATMLAGLVLAVLGALLVVLLVDLLFSLGVAARLVLLVLAGGGALLLIKQLVLPLLQQRESDLDVALMVQEENDSQDLVPALQFETPDALQWGSWELEHAVIQQMSERATELDVAPLRRPSSRHLQCLLWAAGLTVSVLLAGALFPQHARVFFNRLMLGSAHYPTRTQLKTLRINGQVVFEANPQHARPREANAAEGQPLTFQVQVEGNLPNAGRVQLRSLHGRQQRTIPLERADKDRRESADKVLDPASATGGTLYEARLDRVTEDLHYQVYIGDSWTDPATVRMIDLPLVDVQWQVTPPAYAAELANNEEASAARQLSVLQGSRVELAVREVNRKTLKQVRLELIAGQDRQQLELVAAVNADQDADKDSVWRLPPQADTLIRQVQQDTRFEIQVRDQDGLELAAPIRGIIRVRPDRTPHGTMKVVHRVLLPTAAPQIECELHDDYGIAAAELRVQIERVADRNEPLAPQPDSDALDSNSTDSPATDGAPEPASSSETSRSETSRSDASRSDASDSTPGSPTDRYLVNLLQSPSESKSRIVPRPLPFQITRPLLLAQWQLRKGDRLSVQLQLRDDRGEQPGATYLSDPIYLEISDESGVLAAISEVDEQSEKQLTEIIKQELGIGESP